MKTTTGTMLRTLFLGLCLAGGSAWGQESRAVVTGSVSDSQGALIAAATITVTNMEANVATSVKSNERGIYSVPPMNPGMYRVEVSATGFKKLVQSNIELRTGDRKGLDFTLEVGGITETVTVTSEAVLLDSQSSSLGTVMNQRLVEDLPTRGRNVFDLVQKTAGVSARGQNTYGLRPFDNGENGVRINGGLANTNEVLLDGAPNTQRETTGAANVSIVPPPEAVGEVKITTNPYDAEFGRTGGGVITMSLRSGTNDLHGSVAWTVRNNIFNANAFESNSNPGPDGKPRAKLGLQHNEPVAQIQGPVYIPHLYDGRNKSFFMYSTDIYRNRRPSPSSITVPTALEARGDFSQTYVSGLGGATVAIYDPLVTPRVQFPGNVIPSSRINPIAAKTVSFYPKPNLGLVARGQPNLLVAPNNDNEPYNAHVSRFDQILNQKHKLFVNFSRTNRHQTNGGGPALNAFREQSIEAASNSFLHWRINHSATFNLTSVLSPTLVSTARFSWNRHQFAIHSYSIDYDPTQLGFSSSLVSQVQLKSFPQFSVAGFGTLGRAGDQLNFSDTWALGESFTKIVGRHSLKYGGEGRQMLNNQKNIPGFGSFGFGTAETRQNPLVAAATSGDGLASMLLGHPNSVNSTYAIQVAQGQRYYTGFFQDDWRVNEKLTLNLGLRWEYESPISERFDRQVNGFDPDTTSKLGPTTLKGGLKFASATERLPYKRDMNNLGPRLGYAYLIHPKVVLRGGWGITYAPTADIAPNTGFSYTTAPSTTVANAGITPVTTPGCSGNSCGMLSNPFPEGILQPPGRSLGLQTNLGQTLSFILPSRVSPYVHSFSTGVQFELPLRSVMEVSYSGNRTRQLPTSRNINAITTAQYLANGTALTGTTVPNPYAGLLPGTALNGATMTLQQSLLPYPQFGNITEAGRSIGRGNYDALMVRFEKRLSRGLTVLASGTFARNRVSTSYLNNGLDAVGNFIVRDDGASPWLINISGSYALPFFSKGNPLVKTILGGWQITGTTALYPGGLLDIGGARSTGLNPALPNPTYQRWFNTCTLNRNNNQRQSCASAEEQPAWIIDPPFTLLTQAQPQWGSIRALHPQTADANFSIFKAFKVRERLSAELRAESFNALNTPHFGNPNLTSTSNQFGLTTLTQTNAPRNIQVGLKLRF